MDVDMPSKRSPLDSPTISKLDDIVLYGIAHDMYSCLSGLNIYNTIAENADAINEKLVGQSFFGAVQHMAMGEVFLSLARAFEIPKRNELRSIPYALHYMKQNAHELPIHNREAITAIRTNFVQMGGSGSKLLDDDFTRAIVSALSAELSQLPALEALRVLRDKTLAHSDLQDRPTNTGVKFTHIDELLAFGLDFVAIVGEGYVGTSVTSETAPHFVVEGAQTNAFSMSRLLKLVGVEAKPGWVRHENELRDPVPS